jgi:hypothetical protein
MYVDVHDGREEIVLNTLSMQVLEKLQASFSHLLGIVSLPSL